VCLARACEALPLQSLKSLADLEHWTQEPRISIDFRSEPFGPFGSRFSGDWQRTKGVEDFLRIFQGSLSPREEFCMAAAGDDFPSSGRKTMANSLQPACQDAKIAMSH